MKPNWEKEFEKLYGDDFKGGCKDKYICFIRKLLSRKKEEFKKVVESMREEPDEYRRVNNRYGEGFVSGCNEVSDEILKVIEKL